MKSVPVVALQAVGEDVQLAYDYFETHRPGVGGSRFLERYFAITDLIESNTELFPIKFDDYRRALIPRSNCAVYYFCATDRSVIVAVIDARRDPRLIRDLIRTRKDQF